MGLDWDRKEWGGGVESMLEGVVTVTQDEVTHQGHTEVQSESGFLSLSQWLL